MGGDVVIRAEGLGKKYRIGQHATERASTLRDGLSLGAGRLLGGARDLLRGNRRVDGDTPEDFWALRNIDFEIRQGDVVGVIGRNGAGKSTLLKILSRITQPSEGHVEITGRVASLLEVGTGFHPELSGRENVFLNGAILGMGRAEIRRKFDEIVAFAEIDKFIDTPVKRYSSGMYVRLAFAVAAHLEPEILVIDEVLAVGDAEFQKKCLGKLGEVSEQGRTVLFVSHNLAAIGSLCTRGILFDRGKIESVGPVNEVLSKYVQVSGAMGQFVRTHPALGEASIIFADVTIHTDLSTRRSELRMTLRVSAVRQMSISVGVRMKDNFGTPVGYIPIGAFNRAELVELDKGENTIQLSVPADDFADGSYFFSIDLAFPDIAYLDRVEDCLSVDIEDVGIGDRTKTLSQAWGWGSLILEPSKILVDHDAR